MSEFVEKQSEEKCLHILVVVGSFCIDSYVYNYDSLIFSQSLNVFTTDLE
jgi:hypothetical protein